jgi:NAD(P)-dependent dehydrogenase (short-subunit alcohol dehydrogenase family)
LSASARAQELNDKVCLIVGASGTLGAAVARTFIGAAGRVAVTSTSGAGLTSAFRGAALHLPLDITSTQEVNAAVREVREKLGSLDVVVNCSGIQGPIGPTQALDPAAWTRVIEVNLLGCFYLAQATVPVMLEQKHGKIIFFSGGGATSPRPFFGAYGASKVAVVRFVETLAEELHDTNIQVNAIAPGAVRSRMWDEMRAAGSAGGPKLETELKQMDETGGVPPERGASLALFLASERSRNLSGRLISAVHDKWEEMGSRVSEIMASEAGTLRRIPFD